jgi:hypothetical protein
MAPSIKEQIREYMNDPEVKAQVAAETERLMKATPSVVFRGEEAERIREFLGAKTKELDAQYAKLQRLSGIRAWSPSSPAPKLDDDAYAYKLGAYGNIGIQPTPWIPMVVHPKEPEPLPTCACGQTIWNGASRSCGDCEGNINRFDRYDHGTIDQRIAAAKVDVDPVSGWTAWAHPSWEEL